MTMERKLQFFEIAGNLPYGLKVIDNRERIIYSLLGTEIDTTLCKVLMYGDTYNHDDDDWWPLSELTPILRPRSDMYRTITHNGKEIVPIVKLAKIAFGNEFDFKLFDKNAQFKGNGDNIHFWYSEKFEAFGAFRTKADIHLPIHNQYQLFDYMNELKIDYRGLIDAGIAIDANTLETNPYK